MPYMQSMVGYDKNCALQFINGWNDHKVTINGITFQVNEEVISMATSLSMKGKKWRKVTKTVDEACMRSFFYKRMRNQYAIEEDLRGISYQLHGTMFAWYS